MLLSVGFALRWLKWEWTPCVLALLSFHLGSFQRTSLILHGFNGALALSPNNRPMRRKTISYSTTTLSFLFEVSPNFCLDFGLRLKIIAFGQGSQDLFGHWRHLFQPGQLVLNWNLDTRTVQALTMENQAEREIVWIDTDCFTSNITSSS